MSRVPQPMKIKGEVEGASSRLNGRRDPESGLTCVYSLACLVGSSAIVAGWASELRFSSFSPPCFACLRVCVLARIVLFFIFVLSVFCRPLLFFPSIYDFVFFFRFPFFFATAWRTVLEVWLDCSLKTPHCIHWYVRLPCLSALNISFCFFEQNFTCLLTFLTENQNLPSLF